MSNREQEAIPYADIELLSVDALQELDGEEVRIGISLAFPDNGEPMDLALSLDDAERLVVAMAKAVYDARGE